MQEKIDWYQEVVDLEPSSKLFFPLAKMLAKQDVPRAVKTLQQGLDRHPEFIEARFFFVELLHEHRDTEDYAEKLKGQLAILSPMLSRYAGFWQAWGHDLLSEQEANSHEHEKALAVSFLGAMCANDSLSLAEVFAAGLRSLQGKDFAQAVTPQNMQESSEQAAPAPAVVETAPEIVQAATAEVVPDSAMEEDVELAPEPAVAEVVKPAPKIKLSTKPKIVIRQSITTAKKPTLSPAQKAAMEEEEELNSVIEAAEEAISLRTRSMADVLAEQGDYDAALEIYEELLQGAYGTNNTAEQHDLQRRIADVQAMRNGTMEAAAPAEVKASPGNERVISVLGALADRLDARLHS